MILLPAISYIDSFLINALRRLLEKIYVIFCLCYIKYLYLH